MRTLTLILVGLVVSILAISTPALRVRPPSLGAAGASMCVPASGTLGWLYGTKPASEGGGTHNGIDIWGTAGVTPIYAAADGDVNIVTTSFGGTYVTIHHAQLGDVWSYYDHMGAANIIVLNGEHVRQGQQIGYIGTDQANGVAHVHFAVNVTSTGKETDQNVDPSPYLGLNLSYPRPPAPAWQAPIASNCPGPATCPRDADLNRDGKVDSPDLAILLSRWGQTTNLQNFDINCDWVVNSGDLAVLLAHWARAR